MATAARLIQLPLPLPKHHHLIIGNRHLSAHQSPSSPATSFPHSLCSSSPLSTREQHLRPNLPRRPHKFQISCAGGNGGDGVGQGSGSGGGGGSGGWNGREENSDDSSWSWVGPIGAFLNGWRSRVAADSQFPFKVLMEQLVGVSASVVGDMASRPNFGLNELDFVFSTLVVGSILNFVLMYLLAPTVSASTPTLPSIFTSCPPGHMFEQGPYGLLSRFGTFVYKGALFSAVGFAAGLVGTAISNGLIKMRKKMDPNFETPNKPPPMLLNAGTWAIHMGVSSNLRYQTLNGLEFLLAMLLPPVVFKVSVVVLRCLNNVLGGMSFVILARLTGSQSIDDGKPKVVKVTDEAGSTTESAKEKLLNGVEDSSSNQSSRK